MAHKDKSFVDSKDAALRLAESIVASQEDISQKRVDRHARSVDTVTTRFNARTHKHSKSKDRLAQVKAVLTSEAAKAKREKAKARQQTKAGSSSATTNQAQGKDEVLPKKRVNFVDWA